MRRFVLCLAALILVAPGARAAAGGSAAAAPPAVAPQAPEGTQAAGPRLAALPGYRFVPGDVLEITVSSDPSYNQTVTIQPDGRINLPVVGEIMADGLTAAQLAARVREGLNVELVDPQVTVSLKELNRGLMRRISVLGAVRTPGVFDLREHLTLAEALALAGGPTPVADLRRLTIARADGGQDLTVDLSGGPATGKIDHNLALEPGDLILVPEGAPRTVLVLGQVARPGSYAMEGEMRVLDALSLAGGPMPDADLRGVTLTRAGQTEKEPIDLQDLLTKGQQDHGTANVTLRPGDTLVVPESERKYYVLGEVNRAAAYPLRPSDRLLDAITTAGGPTHEADLMRVELIRKDAKGQPVARRLDFSKMMRQGAMFRNEPLQVGDVIFVPGRKQRQQIFDYLGVLYPLSALLNVVR